MGHFILTDILIIFLSSIPIVIFLGMLKLPPILGFLATGALLGPQGIGLIHDKAQIDLLAEIGVTLLLFSVGLEFSLEGFDRIKKQSLMGGLLQILGTIAAGLLLATILKWPFYRGVYFGCIVALSSTAIVLTSLYEHKMIHSISGRLSTALLILQDLAIVPMLIFFQFFGEGVALKDALPVVIEEGGKALLLIVSVSFFVRFFADRVLRQILKARSRELFVITVISIALGMSWLTYQMGLSFALGAFLGGLMIGATGFKYQALSEISPLRHSFNSLFFVSIGMLLNFSFIAEHYLLVLILVILIPLMKVAITSLALYCVRFPLRVAVVTGISLGQIGEFSFLLVYTGQKMGMISPFFYNLIVAVAVVSMLMTPLMVAQSFHLCELFFKIPFLKRLGDRSSLPMVIAEESKTLNDHVIICGFGPLAAAFGKLLKEHHIPYLVLDLNPETVEEMRKKEGNIFFGDGASEEILYQSGIDRARILAITAPDFLNIAAIIYNARRLNPDIYIITRARYRSEVEKLYQVGADVVISEELEGGIEMGRFALAEMGINSGEVDAYIQKVREFGSADFF